MTPEELEFNGASIKMLARASLPILLPLAPERVSIGSGFDSRLACENASAWRPTVFSQLTKDKIVGKVELHDEKHSYRDNFSFTSHQNSEHFSGSLAVTVGNDLLSGGVEGQYDKLMTESSEV